MNTNNADKILETAKYWGSVFACSASLAVVPTASHLRVCRQDRLNDTDRCFVENE